MSKAARYFREEHNLQLVRLVAQTSLKSNVTLAIPQHMQHKFLNYMEDLFYQPSTGIFGDGVPGAMQNVRNSNNGKNANPTLHPSGKDKDAAIPPLAPVSHSVDQRALTTFPIESPGASRKRVAVLDLAASELNQSVVSRTSPHRSGGLVGAVPERTLKRAKSMQEHTQGSAPDEDVFLEEGSGRGNYHGKTLASGNAKEPSTVIPSSYSGSYLAHAIVYSKNGVKMIRYGAILQRLMKDFKSLPKEARVAIKKGVKQFLMHEMMDQFDDCLIEEGDKVLTFGVPETLLQDFKGWAVEELARCFPQCEVIDRAL
ncbi:hypothetical protein BC830DRAFT_421819 [Chytriomyces sp. MP71]|nr:hypothetical protein BC830DRAFT_421819 [Chytriomyces sp. MP71]